MSSHEAASDTNHPSELTDIRHFLDDPAVKNFMQRHEKETDGNKSLFDTVNAFITVGAFIAGVQAQLLSVTYNLNPPSARHSSRAANWLGFVGLVLDVASVSIGVLGAVLLQRAIRHTDHIAMRLTDMICRARHDVDQLLQQQLRRDTNLPVAYQSMVTSLTNRVSTISSVMELHSDVNSILTASFVIRVLIRVFPWMKPAFEGPQTLLSFQSIVGTVVTLTGGILCLLASAISFARVSQPHGIWISCTAIAAIIITYIVLYSIGVHLARHSWYGRVEEKLRSCPSVGPPPFPDQRKEGLDA